MIKFCASIFLLLSLSDAHATCFGEAGISHADIPDAVLMSLVQVLSTDNSGNILSRATGFIVAHSSAGHNIGLNRVMTVKHGIQSDNIYLISSDGNVLGRANVEAGENDSAILSMSDETEQSRYRMIPGISLGSQSDYRGVISSPSGTSRGASGAPLLDRAFHALSMLTEISLPDRTISVSSGNIDEARKGNTADTKTLMPTVSNVRAMSIPHSLMKILGEDAFPEKAGIFRKGVLTMPAFPSSQCIVHQGYFYAAAASYSKI